MHRLAVIPARSGSKRIPGKNIREFMGKPLIAWSIEQAHLSGLFDSIIVSTDSEQIGSVARKWGAEVPFIRPSVLSGDFTPTSEVILHALRWFEEFRVLPKMACCIYPTAPLLTVEVISSCLRVIEDANAHSALTVTDFSYPVWRALTKDDNGNVGFQWPQHEFSRSQDLPTLYHDAGQCYWINVESFMRNPRLVTDATVCCYVERWNAQDIDTEQDLVMAEKLFNLKTNNSL